jgi:hypothetical protein
MIGIIAGQDQGDLESFDLTVPRGRPLPTVTNL